MKKQVSFYLTEEEIEILNRYAKQTGNTKTAVIRALVQTLAVDFRGTASS